MKSFFKCSISEDKQKQNGFLRIFKFVIFFSLLTISLFAEDNPILLSYRRNFIRANLKTKSDIVNDSLKMTEVDMSPFFMDVLDYVENSYELLGNDDMLLKMGIKSIDTLTVNNYNKASYKVMLLFSQINDEAFHIACLNSFKKFTLSDVKLIELLNEKYDTLFFAKLEGKSVSNDLLKSYVETLGTIGNSASFSVLFNSLTKAKEITLKIALKEALKTISCDFFSEIVAIINKNNIYYIQTAFEVAKEKDNLSSEQLGKITEMTLTAGFRNLKVAPKPSRDLIADCLDVITDLRWGGVSATVVRYFYQVQSDYKSGNADVQDLISVVKCMGVMRSQESADSLAVFLGLLNSQTEQGNPYNEELLLTVIEALGELGDKTAFDYLLYVDYLDYSDAVKLKARNAISRLKW